MVLTYTLGFDSPAALADHFKKHGARLGLVTKDEYETRADLLMGFAEGGTVNECVRSDGSRCKLDTRTEEFGVISATRRIITYFKVDVNVHPYPTNWDYFEADCHK